MPAGISFSDAKLSVFLTKPTNKQMECARFPLEKGIIVMYESRIPHYIGVPVVWLFRSQGEYNEGHV
jgi:hypothetical protein